jgi:4-hydroxybenzoate polyprenyltransferase
MRPSLPQRFADAVFLSRPLLWIPVWGYCAFGYAAGLRYSRGADFFCGWHASLRIPAWMLVFSLSVGAVYVFNQIADREVDAANAGFPLLAKGDIPIPVAWISAGFLALSSLLVPLCARPFLAFFSLLSLVLGIVYSAKPFRLAGRPWFDFLTNAAGYGCVAFGAGWYLSGASFGARFFVSSAPYFLLMCAGSISSTLPDAEGDAAHGKNTTAVVLGVKKAHYAACVFIAAGLVSALLAGDWAAAACAAFAVPLYALHAVRGTAATMESTYKIGGMVMMLVAAFLFPWLAPAALVSLGATVLYFRLRFHVSYPSLVPIPRKD